MSVLQTREFFVVFILCSIVLIASVRVGALWLRLALINLLVALIAFFLVDNSAFDLVILLSILSIDFAFLAAWQRRVYLKKAEAQRRIDLMNKHQSTIEWLESMRIGW